MYKRQELDVFWSSQEVDDTIKEALSLADNLSDIELDLLKSAVSKDCLLYTSTYLLSYTTNERNTRK